MREIKLMADYQCHPIWDMTPGKYGDVDPCDLPISHDLQQQLSKWARFYDRTLNMADPARSGFKSDNEREQFKKEGRALGERLQTELGSTWAVQIKV